MTEPKLWRWVILSTWRFVNRHLKVTLLCSFPFVLSNPSNPNASNYESFTLAKLVGENISDRDTKQYLPWPPWAMQQKIK
jgi:hypothetical protein